MKKHVRKRLAALLGRDNVLDSEAGRICYAYDASGERSLPQAVVFPADTAQVSGVMTIASEHRMPVVPRGAGSGLTGGAVPVRGGIVMALSRLNRIVEIDDGNLLAVVQPGVLTADLHRAVEKVGLFYPPDPASMEFSTIGGNIAENAGGIRAVKYGVTRNYVMGLEVVLPGGEIVHSGSKCVKDVVGYDLTGLFVGSEGTLGVVTQAILKLLPLPEARRALIAAFASMQTAAQTVEDLFKERIIPEAIEFMDGTCLRAVENYLRPEFPRGAEAVLLVQVDGNEDRVDDDLQQVRRICEARRAMDLRIAGNRSERDFLWKVRRSVHAALQTLRTQWVEEDVSVPRLRIAEMLLHLEGIARQYGVVIANFGHYGDGNIHVSMAPADADAGWASVERARLAILKTAVRLEGRIAAEHGIGLKKQRQLGWNIDGPTLKLMAELKRWLDPLGILNPGKVLPDVCDRLGSRGS